MNDKTAVNLENKLGTSLPLTSLIDSEKVWQEKVRQFSQQKIAPLVKQMDDQAVTTPELLSQLFSAGLMGIEVPKIYGGEGGTLFQVMLAVEEISRVDAGVGVYVDVQNSLVINALSRWGSGDQKRRYLPRLATDVIGAFSVSEENAGSDAFALSTTASEDGNEYILNGRKRWVSGGSEAGLFLIFARSSYKASMITAFLIERDAEGLSIGQPLEKLGIRASTTCDVILENVRVRRENVLGNPGDGSRVAIETLGVGRIGIAAQLVGLAQGALDEALAYAQQRQQFGKKIATFQGVQFTLSQMATEVEAARLLVYNATRIAMCNPEPREIAKAASMAKYFASEVAERVASQAVDILGGNGFIKNFKAEKYYRDAKVGKIYEGTSNMQLRTIASLLLGSATAETVSPKEPSLEVAQCQ